MKYNFTIVLIIWTVLLYGQGFSKKTYSVNQISNIIESSLANQIINKYKTQAKSIENYLPKGYSKRGNIDYTIYLQQAINNSKIILMPNFPILINDRGLILNDGQILIFQPNSKLILKPSSKEGYSMIAINNKSNIKIVNANLKGDRESHLGKTGQWGFGISIKGGEDITIVGGQFQDMWGDGIYIGGTKSKVSSKILISNNFINNSRRNGISITSGKSITIEKSTISNSNGHSPESGIDIEPNNISDIIEDINIKNLITSNNKWSGILVVLEKFKGNQLKDVSLNITNHTDNGSDSGIAIHGYRNDKTHKNLHGTIKVSSSKYNNNKRQPIYFYRSNFGNLKIDSDNSNLKSEFQKRRVK